MIYLNRGTVLLPKLYTCISNDVSEWMKEVCLLDNAEWKNEPDFKEEGKKLIKELALESCMLFIEGIKEACEEEIEEHNKLALPKEEGK